MQNYSEKRQEFITAVENNDSESVERCLNDGIDVNETCFEMGTTALMIAVENGNVALVKLLLLRGADVDIENNEGEAAIIRISQSEVFFTQEGRAIIQLLLDAGADIDARDSDGLSILFHAIEDDEEDLLDFLLKALPADYDLVHLSRPLITATIRGLVPAVALLLEAGADVNQVTEYLNDEVYSLLMIAAVNNDINMLELLIDKGALINEVHNGNTALIMACEGAYLRVCKKLLRAGAQINHANNDGDTALLFAVFQGHMELVLLLLGAPDINIQHVNALGNSALIYASIDGYLDIVGALLLNDASNINHANQHGETALMCAANEGHLDIVQMLLDGGANTHLKNHLEKTVLDLISENEYQLSSFMPIVRLLIDAGAKLSHKYSSSARAFQKKDHISLVETYRCLIAEDFYKGDGHYYVTKEDLRFFLAQYPQARAFDPCLVRLEQQLQAQESHTQIKFKSLTQITLKSEEPPVSVEEPLVSVYFARVARDIDAQPYPEIHPRAYAHLIKAILNLKYGEPVLASKELCLMGRDLDGVCRDYQKKWFANCMYALLESLEDEGLHNQEIFNLSGPYLHFMLEDFEEHKHSIEALIEHKKTLDCLQKKQAAFLKPNEELIRQSLMELKIYFSQSQHQLIKAVIPKIAKLFLQIYAPFLPKAPDEDAEHLNAHQNKRARTEVAQVSFFSAGVSVAAETKGPFNSTGLISPRFVGNKSI